MRRSIDLWHFYVDDECLLTFDAGRSMVSVYGRTLPFLVSTVNEALEVLAAFNQPMDEPDEEFNERVTIKVWADTEIPF